jgi:hypothetical protein
MSELLELAGFRCLRQNGQAVDRDRYDIYNIYNVAPAMQIHYVMTFIENTDEGDQLTNGED